ncbi:Serine/threonine-protein kinase PknB [Novipirellula aureliae]|uniref:non-specific serine/threonine protein kinase n=1 Tax=Novipirellula aureliae TaxID=2527966 RepID=A0A5C6E979_9BACT|nr:serine/threonine-protein kinase [Novipirellula aureliae]TWU45512.1 Serine/threonine-protein kinase PknB [Novipirellula aureliae]
MPSSKITDYDLGGILGVGTVGTIYEGIEKETQHSVAIKKLHPGVSSDKLIRARFRREMTILERLRHPNIIAYYGGGEAEDGLLYYVMEKIEGGTIKEMIEANGHLDWQVVVDVARQICSALQCAHNHGVIHRDLKPGNLFLTKSAVVKLGDFGIARDLTNSDLTATGLTVGTHAYMSPEQITGDALISGKTDLYALGCCLFEMLSGRKTFMGENFAQLFEQHLRTRPQHIRELVPNCPTELDEIIDKLLEKNPEDRPFNARAVQGVMLQLGERYGLEAELDQALEANDVGADALTEKGRQILQQQILDRLEGRIGPSISWGRLAAVGVLVCGIVLAAILLSPK